MSSPFHTPHPISVNMWLVLFFELTSLWVSEFGDDINRRWQTVQVKHILLWCQLALSPSFNCLFRFRLTWGVSSYFWGHSILSFRVCWWYKSSLADCTSKAHSIMMSTCLVFPFYCLFRFRLTWGLSSYIWVCCILSFRVWWWCKSSLTDCTSEAHSIMMSTCLSYPFKLASSDFG